MHDAQRDPFVGHTVAGKYRVVRLVARGGMGRIYLAEQEPLGRAVALKVLDARYVQSDQDPEFQKRFLLEAATCARLTHPNTVKVFDYGRIDDIAEETYFMVMEFIEGRTLRQALKEFGHFPPGRALRVAREIARSLREAHRQGIIHRDLKPSNVMLVASDEGESVKVLDFGIVKVVRDDFGDLTVGGRFLGSPRYMSPEVIHHHDIDTRSDIYSLGVLIYEMLSGRPPFAGEKSVATMMAHLSDPVPPIRERTGVEVPVMVEAIARRCLEKDPRNRFQNVDELITTIDAISRELALDVTHVPRGAPIVSPASVVFEPSFSANTSSHGTPMQWQRGGTGPTLPPPPTGRGQSTLLIAAGIAVALLLVIVGLLWDRRDSGPGAPLPGPAAASTMLTATAPPPPTSPPTQVAPTQSASVVLVTTPDGVEIVEGERVLGVTPMTLPIDPVALAAHPRLLQLRRDGYQPQTIELGPVPAGTVLQRTLLRAGGGRPPPRPRPPGSAATPMDIRTSR